MHDIQIQTFDLSKIFKLRGKKKEILALNNINLSVERGEIFGLLGPNGAGKTTLISILTTLIQPTSGYALIDGHNIIKNPDKAKSKIALMLGHEMIYHRMTGYQNLKFFCKIYKIPNYKEKIIQIAKNFNFSDWLEQYVEKYSNGMKMKLALIRTLLLNRDLIFLDEPMQGLDVKLKNYVIEKLREIEGTIFITSHDMSVIERLCDRIAFIDKGTILKVGTKEDLKSLMQAEIKLEVKLTNNVTSVKNELNQANYVNSINETKDGMVISMKNRKYYKNLLSILSKYEILKVKEIDTSIEDLFLQLI